MISATHFTFILYFSEEVELHFNRQELFGLFAISFEAVWCKLEKSRLHQLKKRKKKADLIQQYMLFTIKSKQSI